MYVYIIVCEYVCLLFSYVHIYTYTHAHTHRVLQQSSVAACHTPTPSHSQLTQPAQHELHKFHKAHPKQHHARCSEHSKPFTPTQQASQ